MPWADGSCSIWRKRYFMTACSQELHPPHMPKRQSTRSPSQGSSLHASSSSRGLAQGLPPPEAWTLSFLVRVFRPPPQLFVQRVHSVQCSIWQSTISSLGTEQEEVSFMTPSHTAPPFRGCSRTSRARKRCSVLELQCAGCQGAQSPSAQSTGSLQSFLHLFVSRRGPSQRRPPHSASTPMERRRSQSCAQVGFDHGAHAAKWQSRFLHSPSQAV
mmetsp:Transcript_47887/g.102649  ORF Transcript_47887/g.102649 Transcript_47887/m.102649 type:complete len:215 (+) Transcript_47887:1678-2322(+)